MNSCSQLSEMSMISQVMSFLYHGPCLHLYLSLIRRMRRMMMMLIPRWALIRSGVMSGWTIRDCQPTARIFKLMHLDQKSQTFLCFRYFSDLVLVFVQTDTLNLTCLTAIFLFILAMTERRMNVIWRAPKSWTCSVDINVFSIISSFDFTFVGRRSYSNCHFFCFKVQNMP